MTALNPQQLSEKIQAEVRRRRMWVTFFWIIWPPLSATLFFYLFSRVPFLRHVSGIPLIGPAAPVIPVSLGLILFSWLYVRCPACGKQLGDFSTKVCKRCGTRLQE
jgi:hypothetical protein